MNDIIDTSPYIDCLTSEWRYVRAGIWVKDIEGQSRPQKHALFCGVCSRHMRHYLVHAFMATSQVWREGMGKTQGQVCLHCFEAKLGRKLTLNDLTPFPINYDHIVRLDYQMPAPLKAIASYVQGTLSSVIDSDFTSTMGPVTGTGPTPRQVHNFATQYSSSATDLCDPDRLMSSPFDLYLLIRALRIGMMLATPGDTAWENIDATLSVLASLRHHIDLHLWVRMERNPSPPTRKLREASPRYLKVLDI